MTATGRKAVTDNSHISQVLAAGRIHIKAKTDQQVFFILDFCLYKYTGKCLKGIRKGR